MTVSPFSPPSLIGRAAELQQLSRILTQDGDLLLTGVPRSGRRTLIRAAAQQVGARVIEIDCLRATNASRFLDLLAEGILEVFSDSAELALIQRWSTEQPLILEQSLSRKPRLVWHIFPKEEWNLFQTLLALPQTLAEWLNCRVVLVFQKFPHIRSWDRSGQWETYLQQEIQRQTRVSYVLIATVAETWVEDSQLQVISLGPLDSEDLEPWAVTMMAEQELRFDPDSQALSLFLSYVQGHLGTAIALAHRIWLDFHAFGRMRDESTRGKSEQDSNQGSRPVLSLNENLIQAHHVHRSTLALVEDLSSTFESLILLLPPTQVRLLESLALDPTDSPHARGYIEKHQLSRGGGLQGALAGLEQKGLVYGSKYCYQLTMPLLAFWLKQRMA